MSLKEIDINEISSRDHELLGTDFCSGYTDMFGKWNTGFDCPRPGNGQTVFCCGTPTYKYCCTRRDPRASTGISQSVLLSSVIGSVAVLSVVALVSCFICRKCTPIRGRAHPSLNGGPMYTMHCSSTTSGMYSYCGGPSVVNSPLESVDVDTPFTVNAAMGRIMSNGCPRDPPPPYETAPITTEDNSSQPDSFDLHTSRVGPSNSRPPGDGDPPRDSAYWSTKF